jgi:hypothetical protein
MTSSPSVLPAGQPFQRKAALRLILRSHWTFAVLQVLDLLTTMAAFHFGASEVNPLVARLTIEFGRFGGVLVSKLVAVVIALGVRRRLWLVNLFYTLIVCWNVIVLAILSAR